MSGDDGRPPSDDHENSNSDTQREDSFANGGEAGTSGRREGNVGDYLEQVWTARSGWFAVLREVLSSVAAVVLIGLLLFAVSGVWPPMVAVESGSMVPHLQKGDLVFITKPGRFTPQGSYGDTGVVTEHIGEKTGYRSFGKYGMVVVYDDPARIGSPIIHRAMFHVHKRERWTKRANPAYLGGATCSELPTCPAPHAGFITKGDHNARYDQVNGIAHVVEAPWVVGIARVRVPYLGWIRLSLSTLSHGGSQPMDSAPVATLRGSPAVPAGQSATVAGSASGAPHSVRALDRSISPGRELSPGPVAGPTGDSVAADRSTGPAAALAGTTHSAVG
ncbi:MAG: S26 family signal peptidase [Salinigranum sp.]